MKETFLSLVEKPSRYLGGEAGSFRKDPSLAACRFCLAFPDIYEVGMSHPGHQILYSRLNRRPDVFAERVYAPWVDAMDLLRREKLPLTSLETGTPLGRFDAVGFTLAYELACTNVLAMLDLAGIPLLAAERTDKDPIVLAGGPVACNPAPLSMFIDGFFLGDGEEGIDEIADALIQTRGLPRNQRLRRLALIAGMHLPGDPADAPARRRVLADLNSVDDPSPILIPNARTIHERLAVEIARGCTRGCRFCQAGYLYRPVRERSPQAIARMIDRGLAESGFDDISLLSLSAGDYSCISPLIASIIQAKLADRISVSLPSLRVESLTPEIMEQIGRVKRTGFTIAPEAGSERLRSMLNKNFTDLEILDTVRQVFSKGWDLVKLYFMIGLPSETLSDVDAIVSLTHEALEQGRRQNKRAHINVNVATLVPKPHTPFQWEQQIGLEEATRHLDRIKSKMIRGKINLKWQNARLSLLEGAIARGSETTGKAILAAYRAGCRFDAWDEQFHLHVWEQAFMEAGMDLHAESARIFPKEDPLPWDRIDCGVSRDFLLSELQKAYNREPTTDCRVEECLDCGVCGGKIDVRLAATKIEEPLFSTPDRPKVKEALFRYRLKYSKTGRSRFLGHLELFSAFLRAFRRANLPLAYSQGYSPTPKVAFGPPLPVGVESLEEYVDLFLTQRVSPERVQESMAPGCLPEGIDILDCKAVLLKEPSLFVQSESATWEITLEGDCFDGNFLDETIARFRGSEQFPVEITKKDKLKTIDLACLIKNLERIGDRTARLQLNMPPTGGIGIAPAVLQLFGISPDELYRATIVKTAVHLSTKN